MFNLSIELNSGWMKSPYTVKYLFHSSSSQILRDGWTVITKSALSAFCIDFFPREKKVLEHRHCPSYFQSKKSFLDDNSSAVSPCSTYTFFHQKEISVFSMTVRLHDVWWRFQTAGGMLMYFFGQNHRCMSGPCRSSTLISQPATAVQYVGNKCFFMVHLQRGCGGSFEGMNMQMNTPGEEGSHSLH